MQINKIEASEVQGFIKDIIKAYKKFGSTRIENKIKELYNTTDGNHHNLIKQKIFDEISTVYGVSEKVIKQSNKRGNVTQAKVTAMILLHKHIKISHSDIAKIFKRGQSLVSRKIRLFNNLNLKNIDIADVKLYYNEDFIINFELINKKIVTFKQAITNN